MTEPQKIIAYRNKAEEFDDTLFGSLFNSVWNFLDPTTHLLRALKVGVLISSPVFLVAAAFAPAGTNRLSYGADKVKDQHAFLWAYGLTATAVVVRTAVDIAAPIIDNGASQEQTQ